MHTIILVVFLFAASKLQHSRRPQFKQHIRLLTARTQSANQDKEEVGVKAPEWPLARPGHSLWPTLFSLSENILLGIIG
jgi:hypothetical protein